MDVVILCGGAGTRLRQVSGNTQKVMVPFGGKPFLNILIDSLLPFGFQRFILCTGYQKDQVRSYFMRQSYEVIFSDEDAPLGTGGAVKHAKPHILSSSFLVLNGDSLCPTDYHRLAEFHNHKNGIITLVLTRPLAESDYGVIDMNEEGRITDFREKGAACRTSFINAGIYLMNDDIFQMMPQADRFSLEYDLMPALIPYGCYGFLTDSALIDIGTPQRYAIAHDQLPRE